VADSGGDAERKASPSSATLACSLAGGVADGCFVAPAVAEKNGTGNTIPATFYSGMTKTVSLLAGLVACSTLLHYSYCTPTYGGLIAALFVPNA
jgi:hypothetical protein